jgi:predicted LPLAT superfamily acyltransferase
VKALKQEWLERPEGGGLLAIRCLTLITRVFGRRFSRLILWPITAYFLLRRGPERRASRQFLERLRGKPATTWQVARHMLTFARTSLDRLFMVTGQSDLFDIQLHDRDVLQAARAQGRGVLIFGSHLGSFDAMRGIGMRRPDVKIRAVIDIGQNPSVSLVLQTLNPRLAAGIINARQDGMRTALAIKEALDEKAIVTMLVDRARPGNPTTTVDFLGHPAALPTSPWLLAASLKVPVVLCFGLYRGGARYDLYFESFADTVVIERAQREAAVHRIVQRYADRLAHYAAMAPNNWFNFYDFWHIENAPAADGAAAERGMVRDQR